MKSLSVGFRHSPHEKKANLNLYYLADRTNKTFFIDIVGHSKIKIVIIAKVTNRKLIYSVDKCIFKSAKFGCNRLESQCLCYVCNS